MSDTVIFGLIALAFLFLFFKMMGFLLKVAVVILVIGAGYYYLAPVMDWPQISDLIEGL